jgi:hypothetical protein
MRDNLKKGWVIVCLIWACAPILTYWNIYKINHTLAAIEKEEIFRLDNQFWKYNSDNISKVSARKEALVLPVDSEKLGLLAVEDRLTVLISKYKFKSIELESIPPQTGDDGTHINLYFEGPFKGILPWLGALQNEHPYLQVKHLKITTGPFSKRASFKFRLFFRYMVPNPANPV